MLVLPVLLACTEQRIKGEWQLGSLQLLLDDGLRPVRESGMVFGEYKVLGREELLFTRRQRGEVQGLQLRLKVVFLRSGEMVWTRPEGTEVFRFTAD